MTQLPSPVEILQKLVQSDTTNPPGNFISAQDMGLFGLLSDTLKKLSRQEILYHWSCPP